MKINILTIAPLVLIALLTTVSATIPDKNASNSTPGVPSIGVDDSSTSATSAMTLSIIKKDIHETLKDYKDADGLFNFVNDREFWISVRGVRLLMTIGNILAEYNNGNIPRETYLGIFGLCWDILRDKLQERFVEVGIGNKEHISIKELADALEVTNPGDSTRG
ncbi:hypothetical protein IWQ61_007770 [Dispira simplex]|nr:hypothetical protein IWQ61_007770 [Dispira simplex]